MNKRQVKKQVDALIEEGKNSIDRGWVMSDILNTIRSNHGEKAEKLARDYIIYDLCSLWLGEYVSDRKRNT
jgi:polyhydroxyalkanoate synthesis regulator phasin|tara:strand:+ start:1278 stop:1490 length:213 start_codon:yes stop_codon:yes gene_type:complete